MRPAPTNVLYAAAASIEKLSSGSSAQVVASRYLSLGQEIGRWAAGRRTDEQMSLPVTNMKPVPFHPIAVQVANRMHAWNRLQITALDERYANDTPGN